MAGQIVVQTSSWGDPEFVGTWYPADLPARERLRWHAQWFDAVEVNTSFYAVPDPGTVATWAREVPQDFTFDVKLHRLLSFHSTPIDSLPRSVRAIARPTGRGHAQRSAPLVAAVCEEMLQAIAPLREAGKLSSLLYQLAPSFTPERHRLDELDPVLATLGEVPIAVELRHRGWLTGEQLPRTLSYLESRGAGFVATDGPQSEDPRTPPAVDAVTQPRLAYLRLHGRNLDGYLNGTSVAERFNYRYSEAELEEILARAQRLAEEADVVRVAFNTNRGDLAPRAAARMRVMLGQRATEPPGEQLGLGI